jgi:hypothetical protein
MTKPKDNHPWEFPLHYYEIKESKWDATKVSFRRTVYRQTDNKFDPHSSSEFPINEVKLITEYCIKQKKVSRWEILKMLFFSQFYKEGKYYSKE